MLDFVLAFGGQSTIDFLVVPALLRFVENIYVFRKDPWKALIDSFGENYSAIESTCVVLIWAEYDEVDGTRKHRHISAKVLALANSLSRPWGIDLWMCAKCQARIQNLNFNTCGTHHHGRKWLCTKARYECNSCGHAVRGIECPSWVEGVYGRIPHLVSYPWPLSIQQLADVGVKVQPIH